MIRGVEDEIRKLEVVFRRPGGVEGGVARGGGAGLPLLPPHLGDGEGKRIFTFLLCTHFYKPLFKGEKFMYFLWKALNSPSPRQGVKRAQNR